MNRVATTEAPAPEDLQPRASAAIRARFPSLEVAMDAAQMRAVLQSALLDRGGVVAEACALPKADVRERGCRVQYSLQVRGPADDVRNVLVIGIIFADPRTAIGFERATLAPLAARVARRRLPAFRSTAAIDSLGMALSVFPINDALPTLIDVTDAQRMSDLLRSEFQGEDGSELDEIELVRLRRTPRCVLRYRFTPGGRSAVYGKVGSTAGGDDIRRTLDTLAARLAGVSDGAVLVPTMLTHRNDLDLTLFTSVPGSRADVSVAAELEAVVAGAARAAASMHNSGIDAGQVRTLDDTLGRANQAVTSIEHDAPILAGWLRSVLDELAAMAHRTPPAVPLFAHGDLTLSQFLLDGPRIGVLDFDGLCQAEPEYDLGRFVAYLRMALAKSGNPAGDELTDRFLATYRGLGMAPISSSRVRLHSIANLVLMAVRSWQQLKPQRLQLVCDVLSAQVRQ